MSVFGLSTPEEPFVDRRELARALNVGVRTLDRWRTEPGFPEEHWGPQTIRFQVGPVLQWLRERPKSKEAA